VTATAIELLSAAACRARASLHPANLSIYPILSYPILLHPVATMGKAKKMRSASHKKNKTPSTTNGPSSAELEQYAHLPREQAEMFQGVRTYRMPLHALPASL
jgi:hypothetical protein